MKHDARRLLWISCVSVVSSFVFLLSPSPASAKMKGFTQDQIQQRRNQRDLARQGLKERKADRREARAARQENRERRKQNREALAADRQVRRQENKKINQMIRNGASREQINEALANRDKLSGRIGETKADQTAARTEGRGIRKDLRQDNRAVQQARTKVQGQQARLNYQKANRVYTKDEITGQRQKVQQAREARKAAGQARIEDRAARKAMKAEMASQTGTVKAERRDFRRASREVRRLVKTNAGAEQVNAAIDVREREQGELTGARAGRSETRADLRAVKQELKQDNKMVQQASGKLANRQERLAAMRSQRQGSGAKLPGLKPTVPSGPECPPGKQCM